MKRVVLTALTLASVSCLVVPRPLPRATPARQAAAAPPLMFFGALFGKQLSDDEVREKYNVQLPKFEVIAEGAGGYTIREYQELRLAECDYARRDDGYRRLSSYTGGANDLGLPMPGTAPCLMRPCAAPKTMSFLLPHPHTPLDPAAAPLDAPAPDSDYVRLATWKGLRIASLPFSGSAVPDVVFSRRDELKAMLKRDGIRLPDDADAQLMLAQYNELFSLPWNRDNEVWLPVLE